VAVGKEDSLSVGLKKGETHGALITEEDMNWISAKGRTLHSLTNRLWLCELGRVDGKDMEDK
jgi:hypothetical protein